MAKGSSGFDSGGKQRTTYEMRTRGQITRYEAGVLYKAVKSGSIKALPETTSMMYDESDKNIRFASERYNQDYRFYDNVQKLTEHLINSEHKQAQKVVKAIEKDMIERAGKKSRYYKYRTQN